MSNYEVKAEPKDDWSVSIRKKSGDMVDHVKEPKARKVKEIDEHLQNLQEILLNTNATPIRTYDGAAYTCCFCFDASYTDLRDLKTHTLLSHNDSDKKKLMANYPIAGYVVKLDITSFQCIICQKYIVTLEDMMKHLVADHNKSINTEIKGRILPFRHEEGVFSCVLCPKKIEHFKGMHEHLNVHYGSYVCEICATPFMTKRNLMSHVKRHKQGEFVCEVCSKVFDTSAKRRDHQRFVHGGANKRNKCPLCSEKFLTHYQRQEHMVREHGTEQTLYKCMACDKSFPHKVRLNMHKRRDHLLERRHECEQCDKKFFAKKDLKHHMLSHSGVKEFNCDVCLKSYARKNTLREHMRTHEDDRRFKCEHCEQTFVQKCSWKSHMRSKHGVSSRTGVGIGTKNNVQTMVQTQVEVKLEPKSDWTVSISKKSDVNVNDTKIEQNTRAQMVVTKESKKAIRGSELKQHLHNLQEILLNTNATPIRAYNGAKYTCCFCSSASYTELRDLKIHTLAVHNRTDKKKCMVNHIMSEYVVKLDVTSFQCIICQKNIVTLEDMMKHLVAEHNVPFNMEIKNRMLPFRIEEGVFSCVLCPKKIEHFKGMQEHLKIHYSSYYCMICGAPFITQRNMLGHMKRHKQGEFVCKVCSKVFDTENKRRDHEKCVHEGGNKRNKCHICSEKFVTHYKRQAHMVQVHGQEQTFYKCMACDKSFTRKTRLNNHKRNHHLMERKHKCELCDKKFFDRGDLKNHMVTHTGVKAFECDVCLKSFGRKTTLREHMRIHIDDRRYKCEYCEQAFVQKCTLKSHMGSKHGVMVGKISKL